MMKNPLDKQLLESLRNARSVLVLTGAGMSAESGIPTFREAQTGMWSRFRAEELATPQAFEANPERVWLWYEERRRKARAAQPHAGHHALAELARLLPSVFLVTQNVDGLHQRAGSKGVIELHGSLEKFKCSITHRPISRSWLDEAEGTPPASPYIRKGLARPDIVWFGEALFDGDLDRIERSLAGCDLFLVVGTSGVVYPAAGLVGHARALGKETVCVNLEPPANAELFDRFLEGSAGEVLSASLFPGVSKNI